MQSLSHTLQNNINQHDMLAIPSEAEEYKMDIQQYETLDQNSLFILAQQAVSHYAPIYQGKIDLICRSENSTFVIRTTQAKYALRIHRPNYHTKQDILSELFWLDALAEAGIDVPQALVDEQGERVQTVSLADGSSRYAVLFNWVSGEMPTTQVDPVAFQQLGEITAKLHLHSKSWQKPQQFSRIIWNHDTMVHANGHWGDWKNAADLKPKDHVVVAEAVAQIGRELNAFGQSADRYGLIHADLRLTNLLLQKNKIGVIDFDDCGMSWYIHDLAAAISFNEHYAAAEYWIEHWITGYEKVAHLMQEEIALLPTFVMQRRIQMMAWVGSHAETEMAKSLGSDWCNQTVRLCKKYLNHQLPVGAA